MQGRRLKQSAPISCKQYYVSVRVCVRLFAVCAPTVCTFAVDLFRYWLGLVVLTIYLYRGTHFAALPPLPGVSLRLRYDTFRFLTLASRICLGLE